MPISKGETAIVPRPELSWLVEPEEQTAMVPVAEMTMLERHMAEPEHEVALAEVPEVSRLEVWDTSELECETTVAEVAEVPRLERARLSKDATVVELEAMVFEGAASAQHPLRNSGS